MQDSQSSQSKKNKWGEGYGKDTETLVGDDETVLVIGWRSKCTFWARWDTFTIVKKTILASITNSRITIWTILISIYICRAHWNYKLTQMIHTFAFSTCIVVCIQTLAYIALPIIATHAPFITILNLCFVKKQIIYCVECLILKRVRCISEISTFITHWWSICIAWVTE
jgi:hypothetical protein